MRFVVAGAIVLVLACPLAYADWYAGDAVVHLVYAEHAADGHFFEFNRGEPSSGETSIGYMLMLAAIFCATSPNHVPIIVKIIDTVGWYGVIVASYLTARKVLPPRGRWWSQLSWARVQDRCPTRRSAWKAVSSRWSRRRCWG